MSGESEFLCRCSGKKGRAPPELSQTGIPLHSQRTRGALASENWPGAIPFLQPPMAEKMWVWRREGDETGAG
jgi:hypothetical protein